MTQLIRRLSLLVVLSIVTVLFMGAGDSPEARVKKLGHAMMCTCGCNQILLECNHVGCSVSTAGAAELKAMVLKGDTDEQIRQAMVAKYGMTILAAPTTKGFNKVAWIMPFAIFGLAIAAVVVVVRTWKRRTKPVAVAAGVGAPEQLDDFRRRAREETEV